MQIKTLCCAKIVEVPSLKTVPSAKRCLSPADIRGALTIARCRPDYLRAAKEYPELLADKRVADLVKQILNSLDSAIQQGDPSYFVTDLTRQAAHNWRPRS